MAVGTYGTDRSGNLVPEYKLRLDPTSLTSILFRSLNKEERFAVDEEATLFSNLEPIGMGWNAAAVLWNGSEKLGWLAADNAVQRRPLSRAHLNILALYAVTLGTLLGQKRSQAELLASERRLRLLAQNSPDFVYILYLNEPGRLYLNRETFLGYSQNEMQGAGSLIKSVHPDDIERVMAHWQTLTTQGEQHRADMIEYRMQDKLGEWHWVQSRETIFAATAEGKPTQILVTLTDITVRKTAEEKLTHERDLLRTIIDNTPDYIFIKDRQGRFVLGNMALARATNLNGDELVGKTVFDLLPFEQATPIQADDECVMKSGENIINIERSVKDNTTLMTKIPLRDPIGKVTGLLGISRDITERKQLEQKTLELENERVRINVMQRFIHDISHDFRTPLAVINSSLYLIKKIADPEKREIYVSRAEQHVLRMDSLLEEVLQMENFDTGNIAFQFSGTDINSLLQSVVAEYQYLSSLKQIAIEFVPYMGGCTVQVDRVEIARAVTKLLDNAITFTPKSGHIAVRIHHDSEHIIISVQDSGVGIATDDLPHIFDRFYRADGARSLETGGSGLGLPIVQRIMDAHRGSVEVQSAVGQGSTFSLKLPLG